MQICRIHFFTVFFSLFAGFLNPTAAAQITAITHARLMCPGLPYAVRCCPKSFRLCPKLSVPLRFCPYRSVLDLGLATIVGRWPRYFLRDVLQARSPSTSETTSIRSAKREKCRNALREHSGNRKQCRP